MHSDYLALKHLLTQPSYKLLEALWIHQVSNIEEARDRAASRGQESAWRYAAGKEAGFKLAMTAVQRALVEMEVAEPNEVEETKYEEMLEQLKLKREGIQ